MRFIEKRTLYSLLIKTRGIITKDFIDSFNASSIFLYYSDFNDNWGDKLNPFLIRKIIDVPVVSAKRIFNVLNKDLLYGIGSILTSDLDKGAIWGSGFIKPPNEIIVPPRRVLALRGKLSAEIFNQIGFVTPEVYGDPALLYPLYFNVKTEKKYRLGIIPHYKDLDNPIINKIQISGKGSIRVISPLIGIDKFPIEVNSCERILSSSLHGLILSDALGLPNRRFTISDKIIGGDFKFNDYYSGVSVTPPITIDLNNPMYHSTHALYDLPVKNDLRFNPALLVDVLTKYYQKQL